LNFGFDEQQRSFGETVASVVADFPALRNPDLSPPPHEAVWQALADIGLFALLVPERFDGVGMSLVDLALAAEALGAGLAPPAVAATLAATDVIARHGSDAQCQHWLPKIAIGAVKVAVAMLEPGEGYDPHDVQTSVSEGRLNGAKLSVADAAEATLFLVVANDQGRPALVIVDAGSPGIAIRSHDDLDPTSGYCAVTFANVAVGPETILGQSEAERAVERLMDVSAMMSAGLLMGIAGRMLETAVDYVKVRVQFGRAIGAFQAIKHRCADMVVALEAGRSAAYYAFWAVAEGAPDRARAASMAKAYCGGVSRHICNETIQVHGGMGFTWELGLHRYLRRAKVLEHSYGDAAWHKERVLCATLAEVNATAIERHKVA
jgi:alkylation response protein AidB-like acyl-CoA dehydrogenase